MKNLRLKNTITAENLAKTFAGESQAYMRYKLYAEKAEEEGYFAIAKALLEIGEQEKGHAEIVYEYLTDGLGNDVLAPKVLVPVNLSRTKKNILASAKLEFEQWNVLYKRFEQEAKKEGFADISQTYEYILKVKASQEKKLLDLYTKFEKNMLYTMTEEVTWECTNCGAHVVGRDAPKICPLCRHEIGYFKIYS